MLKRENDYKEVKDEIAKTKTDLDDVKQELAETKMIREREQKMRNHHISKGSRRPRYRTPQDPSMSRQFQRAGNARADLRSLEQDQTTIKGAIEILEKRRTKNEQAIKDIRARTSEFGTGTRSSRSRLVNDAITLSNRVYQQRGVENSDDVD